MVLKRRTPLKSDPAKVREWKDRTRSDLPRRTPIKRANPKRRRERFERAYLSPAYVGFIHWTGCVVPGCVAEDIEAAHRVSRARGGTWADLFGCCSRHHEEQHRIGLRRFEAKHRIDTEAVCARNVMEWKAATKPRGNPKPHAREDG